MAGMGNVLRRDDGFGVEVARRLEGRVDEPGSPLSSATLKVVEVGIGGIHLVQELMDGYDVLVVIDALERGSAPGTVHVLAAKVPDLADWPEETRSDFLADMHYTTPAKALILAKALGVLPARVFIVGCQPADIADLGIGLSGPAEQATIVAIREIEKLVAEHWAG
ncbi:MAG TPA: hydrogenase maturation protease [Chloroflexi bacterium]|nr:hydrogenase maturation protease [Chloroflexota bacterium]